VVRCSKCGRESPDGARFCRACGERLGALEPSETVAPTPATPEDRGRRLLEEAFRLSEAGRLQQAIQACQRAIAITPTSTSAHSLLGTLFERAGDREGAIREYEQVLTLSPGSTVERRRLNELMGVAAAPEPTAVSPRTARLAVTGGFVFVALVLVAAIVFTTQQTPPGRETLPRRAAAVARQPGEATAAGTLAPPRLVNLGRAMPRPWAPPRQIAARPRQAPQQRGYEFGQWVGPGAYLLPSGGGGYQRPARPAMRQQPPSPIEGAVLLPTWAPPALSTPEWNYPDGVAAVAGGETTRLARSYYMGGDNQQAIQAYRGYLNQNPAAGAAVREELAWVYLESGDHGSAHSEYRTALGEYQSDLDRGHNVEAARHGVRTCESALKALETR
jgi:tetratricopeptide (TPR) repeat protein